MVTSLSSYRDIEDLLSPEQISGLIWRRKIQIIYVCVSPDGTYPFKRRRLRDSPLFSLSHPSIFRRRSKNGCKFYKPALTDVPFYRGRQINGLVSSARFR